MTYRPPVGILVVPPGETEVPEGGKIEFVLPDRPEELDLDVLSDAIARPALTPCGLIRVRDPEANNTVRSVFNSYIGPEIQRRKNSGGPVENLLPIQQALVVFPRPADDTGPTVMLNDEVEVLAEAGLKYGGANKGDPIELTRLYQLYSLRLVAVGENDGFIWLRFDSGRYTVYFNLLPCNPEFVVPEEVASSLDTILEHGLADAFFQGIFGNPFDDPEDLKSQMSRAGWFPAPALLPDPWNEMKTAFREGNLAEVERLAVGAISADALRLMLENWKSQDPFASDYPFLELGVRHYEAGDYISSVSVVLPRLEGIINRALLQGGLNAESKLAKAFGAIGSAARGFARDRWIGQSLRERFQDYLTEFINARFDPNDPNALLQLGRHAHAHGATRADRYTNAYALQAILALDALYFVLVR